MCSVREVCAFLKQGCYALDFCVFLKSVLENRECRKENSGTYEGCQRKMSGSFSVLKAFNTFVAVGFWEAVIFKCLTPLLLKNN